MEEMERQKRATSAFHLGIGDEFFSVLAGQRRKLPVPVSSVQNCVRHCESGESEGLSGMQLLGSYADKWKLEWKCADRLLTHSACSDMDDGGGHLALTAC